MNDESLAPQDLELLAGKVLGDLTAEEQKQVSSLPESLVKSELESLSRTASLVHVMFSNQNKSNLPASLRQQLYDDAMHYLANPQTDISSARPASARPASVEGIRQKESVNRREWIAWMAVAASVLFAVGTWFQSQSSESLSAREARLRLIADSSDTLRANWGSGKTPFDQEVTGDVVWSNERQEGYMRFVSMPINDPNIEQYQLWIIDPERDEEPIDGGVFDIPDSGEIIVPIDAKLAVLKPAAFAITIEKPGGVVVSTQERLPLLAAVN